MFLSIKDLFVNYGKLEVLKGVSLDIPEGKISVLLGANGSGKSTLLKTIAGAVHPVSGSIWFQDQRIDKMPAHRIVRLGVVRLLERSRIYATMSVHENLQMGAYSRHDGRGIKKDLESMYNRFPVLMRKRKELSAKMSGGEQQTLSIAQALMAKPKLLLLDEPSQGLSPALVSGVADTIKDLNAKGITIIVVEHNLRLGLSIADMVYVLENGKIAFATKSTDLAQVDYAKKIYLGG